MIIKTLPLGQLQANCYILADEDTEEAVVIDPGDEPDIIIEELAGADVRYIVLTHAHFDHAGVAGDIKEATGAPIVIHELEQPIYENITQQAAMWGFSLPPLPPPDILVNEGDIIEFGGFELTVIHTPGHSPGSMCLYTGGILISGDTLFAGSIGRTDFQGGDYAKMRDSFRRLMGLPEDTSVYSGHGPATTIGRERELNMFAAEFLR